MILAFVSNSCAVSAPRSGISPVKSTMARLREFTDWPARALTARYNLNTLARNCGCCTRQLQRFFRAHFHQSPHKWLQHVRMCRAFELLRQTGGVQETAHEL